MFDNILSSLTEQALPKLMQDHGLTQEQAKASIAAATNGLQSTLTGNHGFDMSTITNLFSNATNTSSAESLLGKIGDAMHGNLVQQAGLNSGQASSVKDMLLPMITNLISQHVGGNASSLQSMISTFTNGGGIADMAKGMLGKLFN